MQRIEFSVIIPTYNRAAVLKKSLGALNGQTFPAGKFEIIVVDDGGTDNTREVVEKFAEKSRIKTTYLKQNNKGPGAARNKGIKKAKGKYILFIDSDIIASENLIERHFKTHSSHKMEKIAVLGKVEWHPKIKTTPFLEFITKYDGGGWLDFSPIENKKTVHPSWFVTSNASLKKEFLEKEMFDEDFFFELEDAELSYRLSKMGVKIIYNKNALAYHFRKTNMEEWKIRRRQAVESSILFSKKHPERKLKIPEFRGDFDVQINMLEEKISKMKGDYYKSISEQKQVLFNLYQLWSSLVIKKSFAELLGNQIEKNSDCIYSSSF